MFDNQPTLVLKAGSSGSLLKLIFKFLHKVLERPMDQLCMDYHNQLVCKLLMRLQQDLYTKCPIDNWVRVNDTHHRYNNNFRRDKSQNQTFCSFIIYQSKLKLGIITCHFTQVIDKKNQNFTCFIKMKKVKMKILKEKIANFFIFGFNFQKVLLK